MLHLALILYGASVFVLIENFMETLHLISEQFNSLKMVSLIYFIVSEINILIKFR